MITAKRPTVVAPEVAAHWRNMLERDFRLPRGGMEPTEFEEAVALAAQLASVTMPIVYTAFDGDHFALMSQMRSCVLANGKVPANPESIIGYRDSYLARHGKRGILMDDLSIVQQCDEFWLFSDASPNPSAITETLAEGALIELLWFLRTRGERCPVVRIVSIGALLTRSQEFTEYSYSYEETIAALSADQEEIKEFLASVDHGDEHLRQVVAVLHDPLDSKYGHWLRALTHTKDNKVPLVLSLAIDFGDVSASLGDAEAAHGHFVLLAAWSSLLRMADELIVLPPSDESLRLSIIVEVLKATWSVRGKSGEIGKREWNYYEVPKSVHGTAWSITTREGNSL